LAQDVDERDLLLELDGLGEVLVLIVDEGAGCAGAMLVELVSPEALLVVALKVGPDRLQGRDQIGDVTSVELGTAVAGPCTVVVLRPKSMNDPIVKTLRSAVATRGGAYRSRPSIRTSNKQSHKC
jgi:hypothetical protein